MGHFKNPFIAPVGFCCYHPTLQAVMFFFRRPYPGEVDGMTHADDYDNKNNCQEKAYTALENIQ